MRPTILAPRNKFHVILGTEQRKEAPKLSEGTFYELSRTF
jgi:hypothetical protein